MPLSNVFRDELPAAVCRALSSLELTYEQRCRMSAILEGHVAEEFIKRGPGICIRIVMELSRVLVLDVNGVNELVRLG
jgi:hypothetical protein